jgi:hypothetical protein
MNLRAQLRLHHEDNSLSSYFQTQATADTAFAGMPPQGVQAAPVLSVVRDAPPPV